MPGGDSRSPRTLLLVFVLFALLLSGCSLKRPAEQKLAELQPPKTVSFHADLSGLLADALHLYRTGKFEDAASRYESALGEDPKSVEAYAGLVRCYLKEGKVQEASEAANKAIQGAPDSQMTHIALGEVYFRQGKMHEAEQEFLSVTNADSSQARAYLGLARIADATSMHAYGQRMLERAHELDPDDPEIEWRWLNILQRPARIQALEAYLAGARAQDPDLIQDYKTYLESLQKEEKQPARECKLASSPATVETYLWPLFMTPPYVSGYGLDVKINGHQSRLLLDTGNSGILLSPGAAARAGILPRAQTRIMGIGDKEETGLYIGYADSIKVGSLEFKDCPVEILTRNMTDHDGLVGTDLFAHYLVTVDFPGRMLKLSELPKPPDDAVHEGEAKPEGVQDRYIAPEMDGYTSVFRFGHMLLVPTWLNDAPTKLFLIDTGSDHSYISLPAAREVTSVDEDPETIVKGLKGKKKGVYRAGRVTLSFGHYRHETEDLVVFDHSALSQDAGTEISGTLGFSLLRVLKIRIDYRDGLVDFNYDPTRLH